MSKGNEQNLESQNKYKRRELKRKEKIIANNKNMLESVVFLLKSWDATNSTNYEILEESITDKIEEKFGYLDEKINNIDKNQTKIINLLQEILSKDKDKSIDNIVDINCSAQEGNKNYNSERKIVKNGLNISNDKDKEIDLNKSMSNVISKISTRSGLNLENSKKDSFLVPEEK